jgi:hypothetical protein
MKSVKISVLHISFVEVEYKLNFGILIKQYYYVCKIENIILSIKLFINTSSIKIVFIRKILRTFLKFILIVAMKLKFVKITFPLLYYNY